MAAPPPSGPLRVGILLYPDVEELDFAGPLEVFGLANRLLPGNVAISLLSKDGKPVRAVYGLRVAADRPLSSTDALDLLMIPGGKGARQVVHDTEVLLAIRELFDHGCVVASVCTGALVLAAAGLLAGQRATTHHNALHELAAFPGVQVEQERYIDLGPLATSGGISSGIDLSLHLVARFLGVEAALHIAERLEYAPALPLTGELSGLP